MNTFQIQNGTKTREYTLRSFHNVTPYLEFPSGYLNLTTNFTNSNEPEFYININGKNYRPIQTVTTTVSGSSSTTLITGYSGRSTYNTTTGYSGRSTYNQTSTTGYSGRSTYNTTTGYSGRSSYPQTSTTGYSGKITYNNSVTITTGYSGKKTTINTVGTGYKLKVTYSGYKTSTKYLTTSSYMASVSVSYISRCSNYSYTFTRLNYNDDRFTVESFKSTSAVASSGSTKWSDTMIWSNSSIPITSSKSSRGHISQIGETAYDFDGSNVTRHTAPVPINEYTYSSSVITSKGISTRVINRTSITDRETILVSAIAYSSSASSTLLSMTTYKTSNAVYANTYPWDSDITITTSSTKSSSNYGSSSTTSPNLINTTALTRTTTSLISEYKTLSKSGTFTTQSTSKITSTIKTRTTYSGRTQSVSTTATGWRSTRSTSTTGYSGRSIVRTYVSSYTASISHTYKDGQLVFTRANTTAKSYKTVSFTGAATNSNSRTQTGTSTTSNSFTRVTRTSTTTTLDPELQPGYTYNNWFGQSTATRGEMWAISSRSFRSSSINVATSLSRTSTYGYFSSSRTNSNMTSTTGLTVTRSSSYTTTDYSQWYSDFTVGKSSTSLVNSGYKTSSTTNSSLLSITTLTGTYSTTTNISTTYSLSMSLLSTTALTKTYSTSSYRSSTEVGLLLSTTALTQTSSSYKSSNVTNSLLLSTTALTKIYTTSSYKSSNATNTNLLSTTALTQTSSSYRTSSSNNSFSVSTITSFSSTRRTSTSGYSGKTSSVRTTGSGYRTETSTTGSGSTYYSGYTATRLETVSSDGSGHNTGIGWYSRTMTSYTSKISWSVKSAGAGGNVYSYTHYDTVISNYVDNRTTKTITKTIHGSDYKPFDSNFITTVTGTRGVTGTKTSSTTNASLLSTTALTKTYSQTINNITTTSSVSKSLLSMTALTKTVSNSSSTTSITDG